ncbi:hypothetical protein ACFLYE_02240 [Chloroflexota bacterium]
MNNIPGTWNKNLAGDIWHILDEDSQPVATITSTEQSEAIATLIASSPYMLEALKQISELIGDEDLPDNGELSGAAICDMVRAAVELATGDKTF